MRNETQQKENVKMEIRSVFGTFRKSKGINKILFKKWKKNAHFLRFRFVVDDQPTEHPSRQTDTTWPFVYVILRSPFVMHLEPI